MASRTFNQFQGTLQKGVVTLYGKIAFAAGVPSLVTTFAVSGGGNQNPSSGFASVTDVGAGVYKVALQDSYVRLLGVTVTEVNSSSTVTQVVVTDDQVSAQTSPYLTVKLAAADLGTTTVLISVTLANSTAL